MGDNLVLLGYIGLALLAGALLHWCFVRRRIHRDPRRSLSRVLLGNGAGALSLVALILLAGECYFRFVYDASDAYGMGRAGAAWFERHWRLNKKGVRDSEEVHGPDRAVGKRRVEFIGDSFTTGHGVEDVDRRFANLVRARHREWEVDVFAVNGWDTGDELGGLKEIAEHRHGFDVVVLVYNINDVADILPLRTEIAGRSRQEPPFLFRHGFFLNTLWVRWAVAHDPVLSTYYGSLVQGYVGEPWEEQKLGLRRIEDLVRENGGRLVVVTFPFLDRLGESYPYRAAHAKLDEFWKTEGVLHLDLLSVMEAHRAENLIVSRKDPHPNERAHELAADAIEAFLAEPLSGAGK